MSQSFGDIHRHVNQTVLFVKKIGKSPLFHMCTLLKSLYHKFVTNIKPRHQTKRRAILIAASSKTCLGKLLVCKDNKKMKS